MTTRNTQDSPLAAHSLAEAYFYLMANFCPACREGGLRPGSAKLVSATDAPVHIQIPAVCGKCKAESSVTFTLPAPPRFTEPAEVQVNESDEPSRIIDLAQWITLSKVIIEAAGKEPDKVQSRRLGMEAAQCLEEALKFYSEDNDLPDAAAFFSESSRQRFRDQPQNFSRQRLVNMRAKLPTLSVMRSRLQPKPARPKRWWPWGK